MISKYVEGIDHVALKLSSLEEGLRFFHGLLGFKVKYRIAYEGTHIVILQAGKVQLEIWEDPGAGALSRPDQPLGRQGVNHIALSVRDLNKVLDAMRQHGYGVVKDVYAPTQGIREAVVLGPDNIEVQFVEQNIPLLIWRTIKGDFRMEP